jgi:hypothetical protein
LGPICHFWLCFIMIFLEAFGPGFFQMPLGSTSLDNKFVSPFLVEG